MAKSKTIQKPARDEAREAVRTLIRWAGDDPDRAGLRATPDTVLDFYARFFTGYNSSAASYKDSVAQGLRYDDMIMVRDIRVSSFCEHHMLPAQGHIHIAYIPGAAVAGIGTIARLAADCARRLTTQEALCEDIVGLMDEAFAPKGVAVIAQLAHGCMSLQGDTARHSSRVITTRFSGAFKTDPALQNRVLTLLDPACETREQAA